MPNLNPFDPKNRKYAVALGGAVAIVVAQLLPSLPPQYKPWAVAVLAVASALGVYQARNEPAEPVLPRR